MICRKILTGIALLMSLTLKAEVLSLTLDAAVARARSRSVDAAVAVNELRSAYWEYRSYRADLLPEVKLTATFPSYNKRFNSYQQSDGAYTFIRDDNIMLSGALAVEQRIWLTGGTLSLTSSLDYLRQLSGSKSNRFMSVPVALRLTQPLFGVNDVKWNRRIEPVRYEEAKAAYISATEEVAMTAIQYFFNLLAARESRMSAEVNLRNAEKLYEVACAKRAMGRISENDLMQIELNLLNSRSALTESESDMKGSMFRLCAFLDFPENIDIEPVQPQELDVSDVVFADALEHALAHNSFSLNIRRRQLEADYEVAKAKGNLRDFKLFAQVGLTGTDTDFPAAYSRLKDNQVMEVGISLPLVDWGKRRGRVKVAESNRELTKSILRKEQADFSQNLFILVEKFNNQRGQLALSARADSVAGRRYDSSVATFLTGRISALDLNDSQTVKDSARVRYLNELFYYWYYYYQLRSITLWDFTGRRPIEADFEEIIRN
ncbi:MAG: TolC family protein [Muribaculaceae bacterium]|nr:TolC family protein [Muribaculaceae bacterium]